MTIKTHTYTWQGIDRTGARISGLNQGRSPALIKALLRTRGIRPTHVARQRRWALHMPSTLNQAELTRFSRQLATLFQAGIPLLQGFDIIADGASNPALRQLLEALKTDIGAGSSLADALRKHPRYFDALYCNLIAVGELSGCLDTLLDELATYQEKREALRSRLKKAMTYPLLVLLVGFGVAALLLLKVVPQFESLFAGFGAELPAFTQAVITFADWLGEHAFTLLAVALGTGFGARQAYRRKPAFRRWALHHGMRLPIVGALMQHAAMARFARTLATAFSAGVPLLEALGPVAAACGNALYQEAIQRLRQALASGSSLSAALRANRLFPALSVQMCGIGETSGTLDDMLRRIANHHEQAVDQLLDKLASLLEPLIVLILGLLVGSLVIAMYLPIFSLGDVI